MCLVILFQHYCYKKVHFFLRNEVSRPYTSKLHFVSVFKFFFKKPSNVHQTKFPDARNHIKKKESLFVCLCVCVCVCVCQQFFVERLQAKRFDLQSWKWYYFVGNFKEMCPLLVKIFWKVWNLQINWNKHLLLQKI